MYYIYIIKSLAKIYTYTGITDDLDRRLSQHNKGYNKTTKFYAPFKLIYSEQCSDRAAARKREKWFKSGIGREWLMEFEKV